MIFIFCAIILAAGFIGGGSYVGNHYDPNFENPPKAFKWLSGYYFATKK